MRDSAAATGLRIVLYSHDSVGLGHTRRNLAVAEALAAGLPAATGRPVSGLVISGESDAAQFGLPRGWDWVLVPGITKPQASSQADVQLSGGTYVPRSLAIAPRHVLGLRSSVITGALLAFRPHLVIVDRHPFGADGELAEPLAALKAASPETRFVLGLREVLDEPAVAKREWASVGVERVADQYDDVWVYGDRAVHDTVATGEVPVQLAPRTRFTGLLSANRPVRECPDMPAGRFVLTMVGGGGDGFALARAAAAAQLPAGIEHVIVTGPQMPLANRIAVHAAAKEAGIATRVVTSVPDGLAYIRQAEAFISMGGYNSISEALSTDTPTLVIPRVLPRTEQLIRARALAAWGALDWSVPVRLTPPWLTDWIATAVHADGKVAERQTQARQELRLDGLDRVVEYAAALTNPGHSSVRALPRRRAEATARSTGQTVAAGDITRAMEGQEIAHVS